MTYFPEREQHRLIPDVETEWGTFTNPHIQYGPGSYVQRAFPVPAMIRGSNPALGPANPNPNRAALGQSNGVFDEKWQLIVLVGIIGLVAFLIGKGTAVKRNPTRRRRCASTMTRRRQRRAALDRPRDEAGRFL